MARRWSTGSSNATRGGAPTRPAGWTTDRGRDHVTASSFTHVALVVEDLDVSVDFYRRFAAMEIVHKRREHSGGRTAWLSDGTLPFVLVLVAPGRRSLRRSIARAVARFWPSPSHLGVACESREQVESLCDLARREGRLRKSPRDAGPVVGYYGMIADPDGYNLEVSHGQEVGLAVQRGGGVEQPERCCTMPRRPEGDPATPPRARDEGPDVDGHWWHSPRYVDDWIRAREEEASLEYRATQRQHLDRIVKRIPHDRGARITILDLGTGWGRLAHHLLETFPNAHLVACDFSQPMLERARHNLAAYGDRVGFVDADLAQGGAVSDLGTRFDVVVTAHTLHHLLTRRLAGLYREIHVVLAPGGAFVNLDRARRRSAGWLAGLQRRLSLARHTASAHGATRAEQLRMLGSAGFTTNAETVGNLTLIVGSKQGSGSR